MRNYWSNSKIADYIRGTKQPKTETSEGWAEWEKKAKLKHPVRYWIAEELLDYIQSVVCFPKVTLQKIEGYINKRWITKSHTLQSNLKKGDWHNLDERILHSLFDELVNFVEIEKSRLAYWTGASEHSKSIKYKISRKIPFYNMRNPKEGVDYLNEETGFIYDEWDIKGDPSKKGALTQQALAAKEILELYFWWKDVRPNRMSDFELMANVDHQEYFKKEQELYEEDTQMLIRLIKVRGHLWI